MLLNYFTRANNQFSINVIQLNHASNENHFQKIEVDYKKSYSFQSNWVWYGLNGVSHMLFGDRANYLHDTNSSRKIKGTRLTKLVISFKMKIPLL